MTTPTYAGQRRINDADSHLMELPDFLTRFAPAALAARIPDIGAATTGQFDTAQWTGRTAHAAEHVAQLVALGPRLTRGPKWHAALGAFNSAERAQALDQLGFERQVVFSSLCARLVFAEPDLHLRYALARAHNDSMADFCSADARLLGVAMVPLDDVDAALAEIERVASLGLAAVWIAADPPGGRSPGHPDHEPLWAALAAHALPFILHVGSAPLAIEDAWMNDGRPTQDSARGGAEVIGSKDLTVIHQAAQKFISVLVLDCVLERHRALRGGVIEIGAGWVPDMLRRLDHAATIWSRSEPHLATFQRLPSQQVREQLRFTPYPFEDVAQLVDESAPELYMFSSDYPHAEGGRDPIGRFLASTERLGEHAQRLFFAGNFELLYPTG